MTEEDKKRSVMRTPNQYQGGYMYPKFTAENRRGCESTRGTRLKDCCREGFQRVASGNSALANGSKTCKL